MIDLLYLLFDIFRGITVPEGMYGLLGVLLGGAISAITTYLVNDSNLQQKKEELKENNRKDKKKEAKNTLRSCYELRKSLYSDIEDNIEKIKNSDLQTFSYNNRQKIEEKRSILIDIHTNLLVEFPSVEDNIETVLEQFDKMQSLSISTVINEANDNLLKSFDDTNKYLKRSIDEFILNINSKMRQEIEKI